MASRQSSYVQPTMKVPQPKSYLWPFSSPPDETYAPLSGTPPSPSARQARLISPSHSLPEFLPVLDESSTLKAPLVLPASSYASNTTNRPPLPLPSRPPARDLRRLSSFPSSASILSARIPPGFSTPSTSAGPQSPNAAASKSLAEWVPHLMLFSLLCLVMMVATVAFSISYVEQHDKADTGTFFQISDIHWDPLYRYHAAKKSFCRIDLLEAPDRPFGQYGCDSPLLLLKTALMEMSAAAARPDFILVTGDSVAHNLSSKDTLFALGQVDEAIAQAFDSRFTKRLHVIGVQELAVLDTEGVDFAAWLGSIAKIWNASLMEASDDAYDTFLKGGYYMSVLPSQAQGGPAMAASGSDVSSQTSNVAALVLNTMLYSTEKRALRKLLTPSDDPAGQLTWLEEQLHQARHWGRKVVIAGHIPPGVDTLSGQPMWAPQFEQTFTSIVLQHSDVVVGQLFGYLHRDHFTLMHADNQALFPDDLKAGEQLQQQTNRLLEWDHGLLQGLPDRGKGLQNPIRPKLQTRRSLGGASAEARVAATQDGHGRRVLGHGSSKSWHPSKSRSQGGEVAGLLLKQEAGSPLPADGHPAVIDGGSSAAVLIAPSLSPILMNRPAFRVFTYDRAGLLLDYKQHTADLTLQGAERMWEVQYGARSAYGLGALDGSDFAELSSSFFNSSGYPTARFTAFCELRAAGNDPDLSGPYDCCSDCPNFMRCAVESGTFKQFLGCNDSSVDRGRAVVPGHALVL